jgi:hypothetical protein
MTDTKPTIEEQIEAIEFAIKDAFDYDESDITIPRDDVDAILASLKELAAIKSQPVPVEPDYWNKLAKEHYWENEAKRYAGNSEYWRERAEKAEADHKAAEQNVSDLMAEIAQTGALLMKAEAENKQLVELLKALLGALKHPVPPTQKQWDAIGVVSDNILREVGK